MPSGSNEQLRDRLKAVRAAIGDERGKRADLVKARDDAKQAFIDSGKDPYQHMDSSEFKDAKQAVGDLGAVDDTIAALEQQEAGILALMGEGIEARPDAINGPGGGGSELTDMRAPWNASRLLEKQDGPYMRAKEGGIFQSTQKFGAVELGQVATRDQFSQFLAAVGTPAATLTTSAAIPPDNRGVLAPVLRPLSFLDLIPKGTTDSNMIEYVQVTAVPTGAVETAELALKASMQLSTQDATAPVRTIAGWIKIARQALDDMAGLATIINTLLPYEVRRRIEAQVLAGNGVGQNIRGILNTSGIATVGGASADNIADAILNGITAIVVANGDPNFVALNPYDWQSLLTMKSVGSGEYMYGDPGAMHAPSVWGLNITRNTVIGQGHPLVGDSNAVTLLVREGVNTKVSDSDQDDFVRNRVTVLCEARIAVPVWYPAFFAEIDMAAT